jgi:hypothetical protein
MTVISAGLGLTSLILVYHLNRAWASTTTGLASGIAWC